MYDLLFEIAKHIHHLPTRIIVKLSSKKLNNYLRILELIKPFSKYLTNSRIRLFPDIRILDLSYYHDDVNIDYNNNYYTSLSPNALIGLPIEILNLKGNIIIKDSSIIGLPLKKLFINRLITDNSIRNLTDLEVLDCSNIYSNIGTIPSITDIGLQKLNLQKFVIGFNTYISGTDLVHMTNLRYLSTLCDNISNMNLKRLPNLREFYGIGNITDYGLDHLKLHGVGGIAVSRELMQQWKLYRYQPSGIIEDEMINHMQLHDLIIPPNTGCVIMGSAIRKQAKLHKLVLSKPAIGNADIRDLCELKYLHIHDSLNITDDGLRNLKLYVMIASGLNDIDGKYLCKDNLVRLELSNGMVCLKGNKKIRENRTIEFFSN